MLMSRSQANRPWRLAEDCGPVRGAEVNFPELVLEPQRGLKTTSPRTNNIHLDQIKPHEAVDHRLSYRLAIQYHLSIDNI